MLLIMFMFNQVNYISRDLISVLSQCIYKPDEHKINKIIGLYRTDPLRLLYVCPDPETNEAAGIIGIKLNAAAMAVILHIAVDMKQRGKGIGRHMIDQVVSLHAIKQIEAETDKEAVDFYKSCGFTIKSLGESYPGTERFLCVKKLS